MKREKKSALVAAVEAYRRQKEVIAKLDALAKQTEALAAEMRRLMKGLEQ